ALDEDANLAAAGAQRGLDAVGESRAVRVADTHAIDDQIDRVFPLLVEGDYVVERKGRAVDECAGEPGRARLVEELAELAFAVRGLGGEDCELCSCPERKELCHDLGSRPRRDLSSAQVTPLLAGPRVEQAKVVVDLRDRTDRRTRIRRRGLLFDRD